MDPILAELIKAVLLDVVKIIGPALIASIATYKVTKIQYDLKLKELKSSQSFKAKETLLEHYKYQKDKINEGYNSLTSSLAQILGFAFENNDNKEEIDDLVSAGVSASDMYISMAPFDIKITLRDMEASNLSDIAEYEKLISYEEKSKKLKITRNISELKDTIYLLIEVYSFLGRCNQIMLENQIQNLFQGYLKSA